MLNRVEASPGKEEDKEDRESGNTEAKEEPIET